MAADFKRMTGKPLPGVSNEIAEHDACKLLGLELNDNRSEGFDATRITANSPKKVQIKARTIFNDNYQAFDIFDNLNDNSTRMKRGAMSVARFRNITTLVWTKEDGLNEAAWRDETQ